MEAVEAILKASENYNYPHIALTGGEASLHSRFTDILLLMANKGFTFHFVTNGYQTKTILKKVAPLMGRPEFTGISLSLDGATAKTHDEIRGKNAFRNALATLCMMKTYGKEVVVQMVVHRGNRHELNDMAILCSQLKVDRLHIAHMQPTYHAVENNLLHSPSEFKEVEREVYELGNHFTLPIYMSAGFYDVTPFAHCKFLKNAGLNFDYRGRLTTCCQLSNYEAVDTETDVVGDIQKESFETLHNRLLEIYTDIFRERVSSKQNGSFQDLDHFHCWSCLKKFGKMDWMQQFPENEWVQEDRYFSRPLKMLKAQ